MDQDHIPSLPLVDGVAQVVCSSWMFSATIVAYRKLLMEIFIPIGFKLKYFLQVDVK